MKSLEAIQKTFRVFRILSKIAYILCIIGAAAFGVGALCAAAQYHGGSVFLIYGEPLKIFADGTDLLQKCVELLSAAFMLIADAILFGLAYGYLKSELADGTPFTEKGAGRLKKLGIRFIYIPVIAISVSGAVAVWQGVEHIGDAGNFGSVITGIVLILVSLIFRYGAELEQKSREQTAVLKQMSAEEQQV